jgi:hypothetical protein
LESWSDTDTPWNERGAEQAAVTIQKILMAGHIDPERVFWADHLARFEVLTGQVPPRT